MILTPRKRFEISDMIVKNLYEIESDKKAVNSYHFLVFQNLTARKYVTKYLNKCEFDLNLD